MVSITLEANSVDELLQQAAQLAGLPSVAAVDKPAPEPAPAKRGRPAKTEADQTPSPAPGALTPFGEVSEIISTLVAKAGKPATVKLLGEFEVKRASELKPEQYGPFLAAAKKLLS